MSKKKKFKGYFRVDSGSLIPSSKKTVDLMAQLDVDQVYYVKSINIRCPIMHGKFFSMIGYIYKTATSAQERWPGDESTNGSDMLRYELTALAGFVDTWQGIGGKVSWKAKSVNWEDMDQGEFERAFSRVIDVVLKNSHDIWSGCTSAELNNHQHKIMGYADGGDTLLRQNNF